MWEAIWRLMNPGAAPSGIDPVTGAATGSFGSPYVPPAPTMDFGADIPPLGSSLEPTPETAAGGVPIPKPKPDVGTTGDVASAQAAGRQPMGRTNPLLEALKGVKAPPVPDVVKPSTPAAPRLTPIKGGQDLIQMLMALGSSQPGRRDLRAPGGGLPGGLIGRG